MGYTSQVFQGGYYFLSGGPTEAPTTVHAINSVFFSGPLSGAFTLVDTAGGATQINVGDTVNLDSAGESFQVVYEGYYLDPNGVEDPLVNDPHPGEVAYQTYYSNSLLGVSTIPMDYPVVAAPYNQGYVCFVQGTRIRTARGEVAVEELAEGDLVVTASGAHRPIRWLGHRTIDCRRHARADVNPIRISAHAFGQGRPARDLLVSPGHAICVDIFGEILIPAVALVNSATIQPVEADEVTYWHVELDGHDVILAENLPAESYLDMGNRAFFAEAGVVDVAAVPDADAARRTHAHFCRPYHSSGVWVEAVRARLRSRAPRTRSPACLSSSTASVAGPASHSGRAGSRR